ncbi:hypothetical protein GCM10027428_19930 [Haliea atlantica]
MTKFWPKKQAARVQEKPPCGEGRGNLFTVFLQGNARIASECAILSLLGGLQRGLNAAPGLSLGPIRRGPAGQACRGPPPGNPPVAQA